MFEEKLTEFLHYLKFEKRYSPHTLLAYTRDLRQFADYMTSIYPDTEFSYITHFHIRSWQAELKDTYNATPRTLNRKTSSLNAYYRFLRKAGVVAKNPLRQLHAQRLPERLPAYMKEQETEHLLDEVTFEDGFRGATDRLICELLYATGMRRNELQELKEQDIEWGLSQVRVLGKGNKERLIHVSPALLDGLRDYLQEKRKLDVHNNNYFFNLESGAPLYAGYIYRVVNKYLRQSTTLSKKSPHVLRHTFATHLLANGANIQSIKDLLGHSSLASTQIYAHTNIDKLKEIHRQNHPRG